MLYRFKSRETADILMLGPDAERVLTLLDKTPKAPGIITWPEMAGCIERLKAEAAREAEVAKAQAQAGPETDSDEAEEDEGGTAQGGTASSRRVSFAQRIAPLVQALERCQKAQTDLIWQV